MADKARTENYIKDKLANGNPREKDALEYMKKHKIAELLDNFTAQLLYSRPSEPRAFLIDLMQQLIKSRTVGMDSPSHFDKSNVDAVFGMMDPTKRGTITLEQYRAGLKALGISDYDKHPSGADVDKISLDTFGREARKGISKEAATYAEKPSSRLKNY